MTPKKRALDSSPAGIWFRWNKKNSYSIAAVWAGGGVPGLGRWPL